MPSREKILRQQVLNALHEDIGAGDLTTLATIASDVTGVAEIIAKSEGIVCGLPLCEYTFLEVDPNIEFRTLIEDGNPFKPLDRIAIIMGTQQSILTAERTALNFLMHLSGIATLTHKMVQAAGTDKIKILDTRKTTPGLRYIEKYAVAIGGGENHRFGLYDMVLIKDNHITAGGSITAAVEKVRDFLRSEKFLKLFHTEPSSIEIEVEVESIEQLKEALESGVRRILLDNKSSQHLARMVKFTRDFPGGEEITLEASGNVTLDNVAEIAATGVDLISVGFLTHSAPASDFSLKFLEDD
jgi:nicotinate-nucleotide pyrophosphorylase (carboxylating)